MQRKCCIGILMRAMLTCIGLVVTSERVDICMCDMLPVCSNTIRNATNIQIIPSDYAFIYTITIRNIYLCSQVAIMARPSREMSQTVRID